jgi:hypothetical protein
MPGVFVSHASADKALVDPFVDDIIRLGCDVPRERIFYSSGEDTGIPSGRDLNSYVRDQVSDASIVIAVISPSFQMRPFCIAELGAAWGKVDNLFPIAIPGMPRTDLEGVLDGMLVRHLDDGSALDELHSRITAAVGRGTEAATWNRFRAKWLANAASYVAQLPDIRVIREADFDRVDAELEGTKEALLASEAERRKLGDQIKRLRELRPAEQVAEILLPKDEQERFEALRTSAAAAVGKLDAIVAEAMWYDLFQGGMPLPHAYDDPRRFDDAAAAKRDGTLVENANELLEPDTDVEVVDEAYEAVRRLQTMLDDEISEDFDGWFRKEYGVTPDLRRKRLWDELLG